LVLAALSGSPRVQATVLDPQFGAGGIVYRSGSADAFQPLGSCPHPGGSITVVGRNQVGPSTTELVILRLLPSGQPDPAFSSDGIHRLSLNSWSLVGNVVSACSGLATPEPGDDRLTLFWATSGALDTLQVDLEFGQFSSGYCAGIIVCDQLMAGALGEPQGTIGAMAALGLQPGSDGRWLLTGRYTTDAAPEGRGFIARFNADGSLHAVHKPALPNTVAVEIANAFDLAGAIRFLVVLKGEHGYAITAMRVDSLLSSSWIEYMRPWQAVRPTIGKGRYVGNETLVAPVLLSPQAPALAVLNPGALEMLTLPNAVIGTDSFPDQSGRQTIAATASGRDGVLVSGSLQSSEWLGAAYYAARVDLSTGTPRIDLDFGDQGATRIPWQPPGSTCQPGENAQIEQTALVSWQQTNLILGTSHTDCPWSGDVAFLAMRVNGVPMLSDGFE